jgi:predicted ATPase
MLYLDGIRRRAAGDHASDFPWTVPVLRDLDELTFTQPVTFFVGENGSGKSTLLEGLAAAMQATAMGRQDIARDDTLAAARRFAEGLRVVRRRYPRVRMFMRAEDAFGFVLRVGDDMRELEAEEAALRDSLPDGSWGQTIASGAVRGQRRALEASYGADPDARSHGETFLDFLNRRIVPKGLYFLDEPETPLSPKRVLALLALIKDAVAEDCQFIIATHSPILMACPDAEILLFEDGAIRPVAFDDVDHVRFTRDFLNRPDAFLRHL